MLFVATEVRDSPIEGKGVFATVSIQRGSVVGDLTHGAEILSEGDYIAAQKAGNTVIIQCAIRLVGGLFVYCPPAQGAGGGYANEDYINHSVEPTLLYHCGLLFARRDIQPGEELTADYKYFLAENDPEGFVDCNTGLPVTGLSALEALRQSTRELLAIL